MNTEISVSLVIPVFNESQTIDSLIATINKQSLQPNEVILVDGGSTDNTVQLLKKITDTHYRTIEAGRAMPGRGRNIGSKNAQYDWIAYTDAGIELDNDWLQNLVAYAQKAPFPDIVYGNFLPQLNNFFDTCATLAYVTPMQPGRIRYKSVVSCLLKKAVWEKSGGFPDWRAAEDLIFMEKVEKLGYTSVEAPDAKVYWQLRPDIKSTFQKFYSYSIANVLAGRQAYWHYGVAKQYLIVLMFILLGLFHSNYWILGIPIWLIARIAKRIGAHHNEFEKKTLFNPFVFIGVIAITLVIDAATFSGWIRTIFKNP